jgi:hypothetical protein
MSRAPQQLERAGGAPDSAAPADHCNMMTGQWAVIMLADDVIALRQVRLLESFVHCSLQEAIDAAHNATKT